MWIILAALLGLSTGELMRHRLGRLAYRLGPAGPDEEDETGLPAPGHRWWVPPVLALGWAGTVWANTTAPMSYPGAVRLAGWLVFCGVGLWMSAIDLDVRRLPDTGQLALVLTLVPCGVAACWDHPARLLYGLGAALGCGLAFLLVHLVSRGSLGFGDVKLVAICGWWLGLVSLSAVYAGVTAGCLLAVAFSLLARQRQFAFGPWLVAGTVAAGLILT